MGGMDKLWVEWWNRQFYDRNGQFMGGIDNFMIEMVNLWVEWTFYGNNGHFYGEN